MSKSKIRNENNAEYLTAVADVIVEDFRFRNSYLSILNKLFTEEKKRYESAYIFHSNRIAELSAKFGLRIVCFDGKEYDEGMPVTPLNADEFESVVNLKVHQTIEPTILTSDGNIVRQGTVILSNG